MKREVVLRTAIITVVLVAIFGVIDLFCAIITVSAATSNVNMSATINPSFTLEISANSVALDVVPSASGTFKASSALNVSAYTNSDYNCEIGMTTSNTSLTSTQGQNIYTIPTLTSGSTYTESTFENDSWGYSFDNTTFNPVASSNSIATFSSTTANIASVYFATKLTQATKPGSYTGTVTFTSTCTPPPPSLYDMVAAMSKGTQIAAELQAAIVDPTESVAVSSNSGVYEYNASAFGAASDAASTHKIYYYRGILDSYGNTGAYGSDGLADAYPNYVILDANGTKEITDTCWRIVRTTGSGGVKMIYNGKWTGSTCAGSGTSVAAVSSVPLNHGTSDASCNYSNAYCGTLGLITYAGYNYNSTYGYDNTGYTSDVANTTLFNNDTASNLRTQLENWYSDNMTAWTSKLETSAGWCDDHTTYSSTDISSKTTSTVPYKTSAATVYFGAYIRNNTANANPSLTCSNSTDLLTTSNGMSYPAAPLTADEASFAGSGSSTASNGSGYNTNSYLCSGSYFRLLSPSWRGSGGDIYSSLLYSSGYSSFVNVYTSYGARPTISLVSGTTPSSGSGTATDPWVVQ